MKRALALFAVVAVAACHAGPGAPFARRAASFGAPPPTPSPLSPPEVSFALSEAPFTLTASDGSGLEVAAVHGKAIVDGPLAFTEPRLTISFANKLPFVREGTFRIALPPGASLSRFAMKNEEAWQEGEVVDLGLARRAYEDALHVKQDPAIMEKAAGNEMSAKVCSIPATGTKDIVISYSEELKGAEYRLPLRGLPEVGDLTVDVKVLGAATQPRALASKAKAPSADFIARPSTECAWSPCAPAKPQSSASSRKRRRSRSR